MGFFGPPDIEKLAKKGDVQGLIKALQHKDADVRRRAVRALAMGDPEDVAQVARFLEKAPGGPLASVDIQTLERIGDKRVAEALVGALRDSDAGVRATAAEGLGNARAAYLLNALVTASVTASSRLWDQHPLRALTTIGLSDADLGFPSVTGQFDGRMLERAISRWRKEVVRPLAGALRDSDEHVRKAAESALLRIDGGEAEKALSEHRARQKQAAEKALVRQERAEALATVRRYREGFIQEFLDIDRAREHFLNFSAYVEERQPKFPLAIQLVEGSVRSGLRDEALIWVLFLYRTRDLGASDTFYLEYQKSPLYEPHGYDDYAFSQYRRSAYLRSVRNGDMKIVAEFNHPGAP